jgi:predicted PurR-regulated permease PerM
MNWNKLASIAVVFALVITLLIIARPIFEPIAYAILFMLLLTPLCDIFERKLSRTVAILLAFLTAVVPISIAITLFGWQLTEVVSELTYPEARIQKLMDQLGQLFQGWLNWNVADLESWVKDNLSTILDTPLQFLRRSIASSTTFLVNGLLVTLYTFFLLLYRDVIRDFVLIQFRKEERMYIERILHDIKKVVQEYLYGLGVVILIIGVLNTLGLWLIGIDYPAFWGFLAAMMTIIPYVGTTLGGTLPFIYALFTTTTLWQPGAIVVMYFTIQTIEGNFITPNVVGSSIQINPPVAIFSIIIGGFLWGITGLILALPIVGILKAVCDHIDLLKPIGLLLGDHPHKSIHLLFDQYDHDRYRLFTNVQEKRQ